MQALKIETISGVAPISYYEQIRTYFSRAVQIDTLGLTPKVLGNYDQGKNNFCTGFSSAGCTTYNTGQTFTDEYIDEWCRKYIFPQGLAGLNTIIEHFARDHGYSVKKFIPLSTQGNILLNNDFALSVSTNAPKKFWESALKTGKAIGDFGYEEPFDHAIYIRRDNKTKKTYIENSWYLVTQQGLHNSIEVDIDDMIVRKYIVPSCSLIYKR